MGHRLTCNKKDERERPVRAGGAEKGGAEENRAKGDRVRVRPMVTKEPDAHFHPVQKEGSATRSGLWL